MFELIAILCLDDRNGMMFNNRRQSRDRAVAADIIRLVDGEKLFMNEYSSGFFSEKTANMLIDEDFLSREDKGFYFVENNSLKNFAKKINKVIVYRWNRVYPSDLKLELPINQWKKTIDAEFAGNSHDKITREVYTR